MQKPIKQLNKKLKFYILSLIALVLALFATVSFPEESLRPLSGIDNLKITFIDVDQGDSALIQTPDGETILIDGGEDDTYSSHLEPFLFSNRINKVDTAIVTHYHSDHSGGIFELTKNGRAKTLILPDYPDTDDTRSDLEKVAKRTGTEVLYASGGDTIQTGCKDLFIKVLHPDSGGMESKNFHNNNSLVLFIEYFDTSFIITGDIETPAEKIIANQYDIECDILKVPHHGSSTSSSKKFLEKADPTYAIISAGKDNSYGHPHRETLSALEDDDVIIYRTDIDGDITFEISEQGIQNISFSK